MSVNGMIARPAQRLEPFAIVFLASTAGLIIEIIAARILAPSIGVSLYTWTSVIGIVLAGISAGNYLGGVIADRWGSQTLLGLILFAAAVTSAIILPLARAVPGLVDSLPILVRIVLLTSILFLLPSALLGMVTPVVIKLQLRDLSRTGNVVGKIYAVSTFGAIFGVFITGFVLVGEIGSRSTVMLVAAALVAMAIVFGRLWRSWAPAGVFAAVFAGVVSYAWISDSFASDCTRESNYFCIQVEDRVLDGGIEAKVLVLDQLLHSYVSLDDPKLLIQGYEQIFSEVGAYLADKKSDFRTLFVGGGGYTLPRFLEVTYPESRIEVIEIDPAVTEVVYEELGLWPDSRIQTFNEDARTKVKELPRGQYELVIGDAFNDVSVPYHLTTREFNEQIRELLTEDGLYAINVVDSVWSGSFLRAFVHTLGQTFEHVAVIGTNDDWEGDERTTTVVVASRTPFLASDLRSGALSLGKQTPQGNFMPDGVFDRWINGRTRVVLTDDFAPVDQMLAPLYRQSR